MDFIGIWTEKEEFYRGYKYNYLINEEALDWLTLTERLVSSIKAQIPKSTYYYSSCTGLLPSIETYHYMKNSQIHQERNLSYLFAITHGEHSHQGCSEFYNSPLPH